MDGMLSGFCKGEAWMIMLSALSCIGAAEEGGDLIFHSGIML